MEILPNNVAVISGDTHHAVWCRTEGLVHDKWMAEILRGIIIETGVLVAVDAGANIGTLTFPMLQAGAKVVAIEANPEACECLRHNLAQFKSDRFIIHNVGLGEYEISGGLVLDANAGASWISTTFAGGPKCAVKIVPLDSFNLSSVGLIKMDIEGFEHHALLGAVATIKRCRPVLVLEVNEGALARQGRDPGYIYSFLMEHNYSMRVLQPDCQLGDPQFDIVCYPR